MGLFTDPPDDYDDAKRDAARYRWLRKNPAFETEALLGGLSPEEFDKLVDERRRDDHTEWCGLNAAKNGGHTFPGCTCDASL